MIEWLRALHVIAVIAWMAGIFYLPRLFVYHADSPKGSEKAETFKVMERRLYRGIMTPAMLGTWVFGLSMIAYGIVDWSQGWVWLKAVLVIAMTAYHGFLGYWRRAFAEDRNTNGSRFYRAINEVPTLLMAGIVIAVIVRPF